MTNLPFVAHSCEYVCWTWRPINAFVSSLRRCSMNAHTMCHPVWILQSKYSSFHYQVWTGAKAFQPCLAKLVVHYVERVNLVPSWNQRENLSGIQAFNPWAKTYTICSRSIQSCLTCNHVWKSMEIAICTKGLNLWHVGFPLQYYSLERFWTVRFAQQLDTLSVAM